MASRFSTPRALVEALHNRDEAARLQLREAGFRGSVLFQVARQFAQPFGRAGQLAVPEPLPETEGYTCQTVYLPSEKVGTFSFGGDWYGGRREEDGTLWLIVADITGH